jgi:hypothetical protein
VKRRRRRRGREGGEEEGTGRGGEEEEGGGAAASIRAAGLHYSQPAVLHLQPWRSHPLTLPSQLLTLSPFHPNHLTLSPSHPLTSPSHPLTSPSLSVLCIFPFLSLSYLSPAFCNILFPGDPIHEAWRL